MDVPALDKKPNLAKPFHCKERHAGKSGEAGRSSINRKKYSNYRLEVEYRFAGKPGNCGVLVHASKLRNLYKMYPKSIEVQMNHQHAGDFWCIVEDIKVPEMEKRRGPKRIGESLRAKARRILNLTDGSENPVGEWNAMTIECRGNEVKVWVNGDLVNHGFDCTAKSGKLSIQAEGSEVEFRKLDIRSL